MSENISYQSVYAGVRGDVDEVLIELAPDDAEWPLSGGIQQGGKRNTDTNEDEIGQRQTQRQLNGASMCSPAVDQ